MILSKLYSNKPLFLTPIVFREGLNVVLAETKQPEKKSKDTHNLGKSLLGRLLNYCLLGDHSRSFVGQNEAVFKEFVFYLEIKTLSSGYVTIRRAVATPNQLAIKYHARPNDNFSSLEASFWDHWDIQLEKAKKTLDGILDLKDLGQWNYRNILGYLIRSQDDYRDVFHLRKFAGVHADWKPFLAQILGFDGNLIDNQYKSESILERKELELGALRIESGVGILEGESIKRLDKRILALRKKAQEIEGWLSTLDFGKIENQKTKELVDIDNADIALLNAERYSLTQSRKKINDALRSQGFEFDVEEVTKLFSEAEVLFQGQLKKDFEQLILFNRALVEERNIYLEEELSGIESSLRNVERRLKELQAKREKTLTFLGNTDIVEKYKQASDELVETKASIISLEHARLSLEQINASKEEVKKLSKQLDSINIQVALEVKEVSSSPHGLYRKTRTCLALFVKNVIGRVAQLETRVNTKHHVEVGVSLLGQDGTASDASEGHSYNKLLCVAFDFAMIVAHSEGRFPRFAFHDGIFESLDDRVKLNLIGQLRELGKTGIQSVVTLIDTDIPAYEHQSFLRGNEVVCRLHDDGDSGRLFHMAAW